MEFRTLATLVSVSLIGLTGCDAGSFVETSPLETPVEVLVDVADLAVSGISVEVTGPGISQPIVANLPITSGVASGQITVLAGSDRSFLIRAFDLQGLETHRGSDTVDIQADQTQAIEVPLSPLVGDVDVGARIGEFTLTIAVATSLTVGTTAQASVTVVDAYGDTIQSPVVTWGSSNPAVASVSGSGLVSALVAGQTTIGAAYQGFGGSAVVTVQ